jgi:predicted membrane-bound dolichyl-phosphate-mannose-protein mannosyltransferase
MNERIGELLSQISALEAELRSTLHEQEGRLLYQIKGKRIEFEQSARQAHERLKTGFLRWLVTYRPQNLITGPIIYSMIVPLLLLDLCVTLYQLACFPIYRVARVKRADYFVYDRQHLGYLNFVEKFHCTYCAYANGLLAYASEIVARTEQYFCPIKHARKRLGTHACYPRFLDYGDAADYAARLEEFRRALEEKKS